MANKLTAHNRAKKSFRMICARSNSVMSFKAFNNTDARNQAMNHFDGPVSFGGIVVNN